MGNKLLAVMILIMFALSAFSQNLVSDLMNEIDEKAKHEVTQINISGKLLMLAAKNDKDIDAGTKELFQNIDKISVVIGLPAMQKVKKRLNEKLETYEELMSVIEEDQKIMMYTQESGGVINEFILTVFSDQSIDVLMSITGKFKLEQIASLSGGIKIQGAEHLNKLNIKNLNK